MTTTEGSHTGQRRQSAGRSRAAFGITGGALALAAVVVVAVILLAAGPSRAHTTRAPNLGPFAGYLTRGHAVTSVSATFTVPRVLSDDHAGDASVWVGAQAPGRYLFAPFIQAGLVIDREDGGQTFYRGFWTDTRQRFLPRNVMTMRPGDRVHVSLTLAGGRWHVLIADQTSGQTQRLATRDETAATFNQAEWIQEDPARSNAGDRDHPGPYAMTTPMHMSAVAVNGSAPDVPPAMTQWMSVPEADLAPSPLHGNAFTVQQRQLSPSAARYVRLAMPEDQATDSLADALAGWVRGGPASAIRGPASTLAVQARRVAAALQRPGWPRDTTATRAALVIANHQMEAVLRSATSVSPGSRRTWQRRFYSAAHVGGLAGQTLRRLLDAPGYVPPTP